MPSSDYTSAIGGGLKLKGSSSGIDKKKKKKKSSSKPSESNTITTTDTKADELEGGEPAEASESQNALQKALADEEAQDTQLEKLRTETGFGKTEAQRRHEERRKKRVSLAWAHGDSAEDLY
jgi:protein FAM32A